jgi:hypothetical protein
MARKPREEWSERYRRRVERAERKYGAIFEGDTARIRQLARGHKPREHVTRAERKIRLNETPTSSADYAFLAKQRRRIEGDNPGAIWPYNRGKVVGHRADGSPIVATETNRERFDRARSAYMRLPRGERDTVRARQARMQRRYDPGNDDYEDTDFYDWVEEMEDDITPIYFYH